MLDVVVGGSVKVIIVNNEALAVRLWSDQRFNVRRGDVPHVDDGHGGIGEIVAVKGLPEDEGRGFGMSFGQARAEDHGRVDAADSVGLPTLDIVPDHLFTHELGVLVRICASATNHGITPVVFVERCLLCLIANSCNRAGVHVVLYAASVHRSKYIERA